MDDDQDFLVSRISCDNSARLVSKQLLSLRFIGHQKSFSKIFKARRDKTFVALKAEKNFHVELASRTIEAHGFQMSLDTFHQLRRNSNLSKTLKTFMKSRSEAANLQ